MTSSNNKPSPTPDIASGARATFPLPTKSAMLAVLILMTVRIAFGILETDPLTYLDSRRARNVFLNDVQCARFADDAPEIILLGTSRMEQLGPLNQTYLTESAGLDELGIINLATPGQDFVFIETVLRRNPRILLNAKAIVIDVLPMQAVGNFTYDERGESFLRFASLRQRLHARGVVSKLVGVLDLAVLARSHSQDPYRWRTGFARIGMSLDEREAYLNGVPRDQFEAWKSHLDSMFSPELQEDRTKVMAELLYASPDFVPNQLEALSRIIEVTPEDCTIILVWLPFRDDVSALVTGSPIMTESRDKFRVFLENIDDPKVEVKWYERPEDIGVSQADYNTDGIHFTPEGIRRITQNYSALIAPHL